MYKNIGILLKDIDFQYMAGGPDATCGCILPQILTSLYVRLLAHIICQIV